ncbi:uncharacterized protein STEHIDRAFT_143265 [Stereum hirsutum FP-91666 SS1]|uniref:J domain-containing protein n=1 Tax=Stereum hirsutum (strain FP-91666) TaxID=721885 RepID=R7RYC0_STEHR|nr:uncharacterized protein STEHIDRAFT_143265 [Stereum hirsutum FP-91666 SS1]EIM79342.1 hypothetical protein STEHIDRAFT_143265 [Stereum hirsutum FP-91666 SS1]
MHFRPSLSLWQQVPYQIQLLVQARLASTSSNIPPPQSPLSNTISGVNDAENVNNGGSGHGRRKLQQQYPFPMHRHPTPHQIFHLDVGASQADIKSRYYDLVRSHHPDSPHCRLLPTDLAHSRFQAITKAYDILRNPHLHSFRQPLYPSDSFYSHHPRANRQHQHQHHYSYYAYDSDIWAAELNRRRAEWRKRQEVWGRYHTNARANTFGGMGGMGEDMAFEGNGKNAKGLDGMKDPVVVIVGLSIIFIVISPALFNAAPMTDQRHMSAVNALAQAREDRTVFGMERRQQIRKRVLEMKEARAKEEADAEIQGGAEKVSDGCTKP